MNISRKSLKFVHFCRSGDLSGIHAAFLKLVSGRRRLAGPSPAGSVEHSPHLAEHPESATGADLAEPPAGCTSRLCPEEAVTMSGTVNFRGCCSVLVTGASRGIGLQIVHSLASGGSSPGKIIATTRNPATAQKLKELADKHSNIHIIPLDVVSQESIEKCVEEVGQLVQEEGLNCLINNAGINVVADFHSVTAEKMMENFHTNAVAPLMVTKAFLPLLKQAASRGKAAGSGSMSIQRAAVINITSSLGSVELNWGERAHSFSWYPYRTSKSALNMVTRCLAVDLEADGILCMGIHPGWVRTDMGGSQAPLSPEESVSSTLHVIGGLTEKDHGSFLNFTGEVLPW